MIVSDSRTVLAAVFPCSEATIVHSQPVPLANCWQIAVVGGGHLSGMWRAESRMRGNPIHQVRSNPPEGTEDSRKCGQAEEARGILTTALALMFSTNLIVVAIAFVVTCEGVKREMDEGMEWHWHALLPSRADGNFRPSPGFFLLVIAFAFASLWWRQ